MDSLEGLKTVVAVVETHSFTAASERLGISKALVSKYVGEVERQIGVRLFNRTTRALSLTEAGRSYYRDSVALLEQYTAMLDAVTGESTKVRGLLKISAPVTFGEMKLAPLLPKFLRLLSRVTSRTNANKCCCRHARRGDRPAFTNWRGR